MAKKQIANIDDRSRNVSLLLYPDNPDHDRVLSSIIYNSDSLFDSSTHWEYIGIKHNGYGEGDLFTKDHYHVYLVFENPMYVKSLCSRFRYYDDAGQLSDKFVRCIKGRKGLEKSILYLTHISYPEKEQYSSSDLFGSGRLKSIYDIAALNYVTKQSDKRDIFNEVRLWISSQHSIITSFQLVDYLTSHRAFAIRNEPWVKSMWREHNSSIISRYNKMINDAISDSAAAWAQILGHDLDDVTPSDYGGILDVLGGVGGV